MCSVCPLHGGMGGRQLPDTQPHRTRAPGPQTVILTWSSHPPRVPGWRSQFSCMEKTEAQRGRETHRGHPARAWPGQVRILASQAGGEGPVWDTVKLGERHRAVPSAERLSACLVWACLVRAAVASPQPYLGREPGYPGPTLGLCLWRLSQALGAPEL